ncbi:MAG: MGMT family protein [Streptococcaceae bacterium]|nr:MGMT family protein [Streptococcaceae bacterium]
MKAYSDLKPETRAILAAIQAVPYGEVRSYKDIAWASGLPGGARQVSRVLHGMSSAYELPWWRIIGADGSVHLPEPGRSEQVRLLREEGHDISDTGKLRHKML